MRHAGNIPGVDRLTVFKALGDNTRYAIYLELARSDRALSTAEIAETLELHPNTVRPHLERMREVGLLVVDTETQGTVGRPQHRYSLAPDAPSLGLEPSAFRLLARLMTGVAAGARPDPEAVAEVGRDHGRALAERSEGRGGTTGESSFGLASRRRAARAERCVALVRAELEALGFDPATAFDGNVATVVFTHCPFLELAEAHPEIVCHLHRGIVEGLVEHAGGAKVARFATLADRNPCEVDLIA